MSKAAFFFSLYDHETKDQMLTNQEFYQLINEFFLLLNLLDMPEFHPLDTITPSRFDGQNERQGPYVNP